jgi:alkanesulfonate monooxygenase SsuD/methylene tetrahydromethanopterin reductase-like flavin-dependent oxidoreductase (luciferase family)
MGNVALVVMEPGSAWPGPVGDLDNLVAFGPNEEDLLRRTRERLHDLERRNHDVRVAVLACNSTADTEALARRAHVARLLLYAVTRASRGSLLLTVSSGAPLRMRKLLLRLLGTLSRRLHGTTATVSVRFVEASPAGTLPGRRPA